MKIQKELYGRVYFEFSRKERHWVCSECDKEYANIPSQCSCGAPDKVFIEKDLPAKDGTRKFYKMLDNVLYGADEMKKDDIVSLVDDDRITRNLLSRKLLKEVVIEKLEPASATKETK